MSEADDRDLTLRGLIHDLNNVFQTILDAADLLAQDPKWASLAGNIERTAERGHRLSQNISEATRSTFPLQVIAEIAIQFAQDYLYATKHHPIEFQCDVPANLRIRGNPVSWERILVNLLLNAAQAMPAGGWVKLTAEARGSSATIRLEDNGPGIPREILARIFEAHFSTKPANSGMGLHIVRSLVEQDHGTVSVVNRDEGGASFVIEARC